MAYEISYGDCYLELLNEIERMLIKTGGIFDPETKLDCGLGSTEGYFMTETEPDEFPTFWKFFDYDHAAETGDTRIKEGFSIAEVIEALSNDTWLEAQVEKIVDDNYKRELEDALPWWAD